MKIEVTQSFETGNKAGQSKISKQPNTRKVPTIEKQVVHEDLQHLHIGQPKIPDNTGKAIQVHLPKETHEQEFSVRLILL